MAKLGGWRRTVGTVVVPLVGLVVCSIGATVLAGSIDPAAFLLGGSEADAALGFDPFTLETFPVSIGGSSAPAPAGDADAAGDAAGSAAGASGAPILPTGVGYIPAPRIPFRPPLRSPCTP